MVFVWFDFAKKIVINIMLLIMNAHKRQVYICRKITVFIAWTGVLMIPNITHDNFFLVKLPFLGYIVSLNLILEEPGNAYRSASFW